MRKVPGRKNGLQGSPLAAVPAAIVWARRSIAGEPWGWRCAESMPLDNRAGGGIDPTLQPKAATVRLMQRLWLTIFAAIAYQENLEKGYQLLSDTNEPIQSFAVLQQRRAFSIIDNLAAIEDDGGFCEAKCEVGILFHQNYGKTFFLAQTV